MRSCIITFNIHNICFVGWRDSLLVLFVICSNYAFPLIKKKKQKTDKKTPNTDSMVIISSLCEKLEKTPNYILVRIFKLQTCTHRIYLGSHVKVLQGFMWDKGRKHAWNSSVLVLCMRHAAAASFSLEQNHPDLHADSEPWKVNWCISTQSFLIYVYLYKVTGRTTSRVSCV